jgi:hypothetical protein
LISQTIKRGSKIRAFAHVGREKSPFYRHFFSSGARGWAMTPVPAVAILAVPTEPGRAKALKEPAHDIAEAIVHFLESLPATIRTEILLFVMMYALDRDSMETEIFLPRRIQVAKA